MDSKIDLLMKNLDISEDEAKQVLEADKRIDKGEKLFELTAEQSASAKKARQVAKQPTVYKLEPRERKADTAKRQLIALLDETLNRNGCEEIIVTNQEREIEFHFNGKKYKITLSAPRS